MGSIAPRSPSQVCADRAEDLFVESVNVIEEIGRGRVHITFLVKRSHGGVLEAEPADFALSMPLSAVPDFIGKALMAVAHTVLARENEIVVRH